VGDANAGLHALVGLLHALEHRRRTGDGVFVEAAMIDAALSIAAEQIVEYSENGVLLQRRGNRGPDGTVQDLYACADGDDSWVAVAAETDEQQAALAAVVGDETVAGWCATRTGDEIVDALWAAGVPVAKVMQPHDQPQLEQLQFRRFFEEVEHPVTGVARHSTLPMRFSSRTAPFHTRHAPLLGEHNDEVLRGLGVSDEELRALEADGVIGRAPAR
jgi:crotonobetainyl-CoA:carnitine CoA-transferase CaiB-like acyl-CoA transferase